MRRIILYSTPIGLHFDKIVQLTYPPEMTDKVVAYVPSDGSQTNEKYTSMWQELSEKNNASFLFIDNLTHEPKQETEKLLSANIVILTGGNTFQFLYNLKRTGLDSAILKFTQKENLIINAFSAGAILLSPTIEICNMPPDYDVNEVGLTDLAGLHLIDFEVLPHYSKELHEEPLQKYRSQTPYEVKTIADDEYIVIYR